MQYTIESLPDAPQQKAQKPKYTIEIQSPRGGTTTMPADDPRIPFLVKQKGWVVRGPGGEADVGATAADVAKSAGTEAAKTTIGLPGILGDVQGWQGAAARWLSEKTGMGDPAAVEQIARSVNPLVPFGPSITGQLPTSGELLTTAQQAGAPLDYQAKSKLGQLGGRIGGLAPAVIGGPGGIAAKTALAVGPAIAGQGASEGAKYLGFSEPTAETIGNVTELATMGPMALRQAGKVTRAKLPDVGEMLRRTEAREDVLWKTLRSQGVKYDANAYGNYIRHEVIPDLTAQGFDANTVPRAWSYVKKLASYVGGSPEFNVLDNLRKAAGNMAAKASDGMERAAAAMVRDKISKFQPSGPLMTQTGITTPQLEKLIQEAKTATKLRIKGEDAVGRIKAAHDYPSGLQSGLVNQFGTLGRRISQKTAGGAPKVRSQYTPAEKQQLERVTGGSTGRKIAYSVGSTGADVIKGAGRSNLLPVAGGTIASYLGGQVLGPLGQYFVGPAVQQGIGILAKKGAQQATLRDAEKFARMVMSDPRRASAMTPDEYGKAFRALLFSPQVQELTGRRRPHGLLSSP
jgi:hypothetical protein